MSLKGKWRIVEMPDFEADYPDMVEPAYILFEETGGEFAFGCCTGAHLGNKQHRSRQHRLLMGRK